MYEYDLLVPVTGTISSHIESEVPLTKEEAQRLALERANIGDLFDCDINPEYIGFAYAEGDFADEDMDYTEDEKDKIKVSHDIIPGMVIHCKSQAEKIALLYELEELGYVWYGTKEVPSSVING